MSPDPKLVECVRRHGQEHLLRVVGPTSTADAANQAQAETRGARPRATGSA